MKRIQPHLVKSMKAYIDYYIYCLSLEGEERKMGWQKNGEAEYVEPPCLEEQFGTVYLKISFWSVFWRHLE